LINGVTKVSTQRTEKAHSETNVYPFIVSMSNVTMSGPPIYKQVRPDIFPFISDQNLALAAPVIGYWVFSSMFHIIDVYELAEKYRIHPPEEIASRNRAPLSTVIRAVILQHVVQTSLGVILNHFEPPQYTGHEAYNIWELTQKLKISTEFATFVYDWAIPAVKILMAFLVMDTWEYTLHRIMHINKFLYKHLHSVHHRLYVPYAYGALYNSLLEGFLMDTVGAAIGYFSLGLTTRESIIFYLFSTLKTVDDHCGYEFPFDPFQLLFPNNAAYHDIHHQSWGIKTNFSQPFFVHWDELFKTKYKGTREYILKQRQIRLERHANRLAGLEVKKDK
jgi:sphinganine C4-monooxygenase